MATDREALIERVARLFNANCYDGCEPGEDEIRACVPRYCRCRKVASAVIDLVFEEAAKVAENTSFQFTITPSSVDLVDIRLSIAAALCAYTGKP